VDPVSPKSPRKTSTRKSEGNGGGTDSPPSDYEVKPGEIDRMIAKINESSATVLVIGLGAGRQEKFVVRHRGRLPQVRTFLPLGGTIDYEARTLKRPAGWVTNAGLEWLYRLVSEPRQRWRRYLVQQPPVLYLLARQRMGLYRNPLPQQNSLLPAGTLTRGSRLLSCLPRLIDIAPRGTSRNRTLSIRFIPSMVTLPAETHHFRIEAIDHLGRNLFPCGSIEAPK